MTKNILVHKAFSLIFSLFLITILGFNQYHRRTNRLGHSISILLKLRVFNHSDGACPSMFKCYMSVAFTHEMFWDSDSTPLPLVP